ncbi:hypothetical protein [Halorussus marinus]|uniref:hypothetical protein n=1 Tax=Halorussus marinus TaxID=2505976 RepID=UPI00106E1535|nr:hypothetical protein [Halorussus marinus]
MNDWTVGDPPATGADARTEALFAAGAGVAVANAALYFLSVETLSHPAISVLAVAVLVVAYVVSR